jgi:hypothetical protein
MASRNEPAPLSALVVTVYVAPHAAVVSEEKSKREPKYFVRIDIIKTSCCYLSVNQNLFLCQEIFLFTNPLGNKKIKLNFLEKLTLIFYTAVGLKL